MSVINDVNTKINDSHEYRTEQFDFWLTPAEFDEAGGGDCEDFAIAKYFALEREVIDLWLVHVFKGNQSHMICLAGELSLDVDGLEYFATSGLIEVYRFDRHCLMIGDTLINGTPNIKPWRKLLERMKKETRHTL